MLSTKSFIKMFSHLLPTINIFTWYLARIHLLQLLYSSVQTVLHHITQIEVSLSNLFIWHLQNSLAILKTETITLYSLKSLCTTNQCLYILWFYLKNSTAVSNNSIKVGDLLVACCTVGICLHCKWRFCLSLLTKCINTLCVPFNSSFKVCRLQKEIFMYK